MRHYASIVLLCSIFGCMAPDGCTGAVVEPYPVSGPVLEQGIQTYVGHAGLLDMAESVKSSLLGDQVELCLPATATRCHRDERCADDSLGCRVLLTIGDVDLEALDQGAGTSGDPDGLRFIATIDAVDVSGLTGAEAPYSGMSADFAGNARCVVNATPAGNGLSVGFNVELPIDAEGRTQLELTNVDYDAGGFEVTIGAHPSFPGDATMCTKYELAYGPEVLLDLWLQPLQDRFDDWLCRPCTSGCPLGSHCGGTFCIYDSGSECVVEALGHEANFTLDAVVSGVPAAIEPINYLITPGSYADALSDHDLVLGWLTGFSAERHACVVEAAAPATTPVPRLAAFETGLTPSGTTVAVGFAVSASQVDHALWAAYRAGAFCSVDPDLDSGVLASIAPSLTDLSSGDAPLEVRVTPMIPPTVTIGSGEYIEGPPGEIVMVSPLVTLHLTDWAIEIYALLFDRYVRILVATITADVPIVLGATSAGELKSVVSDEATITALTVTESELLSESPVELEVALPSLLGPMLRDLIASTAGVVPEPSLFGVPINVEHVAGYTTEQMIGVFGVFEVTP